MCHNTVLTYFFHQDDDTASQNHSIFQIKSLGYLINAIKRDVSEWPMSQSIKEDDWLERRRDWRNRKITENQGAKKVKRDKWRWLRGQLGEEKR